MEGKVAILRERLKELFSRFLGQPVVVAYSGGKDSKLPFRRNGTF